MVAALIISMMIDSQLMSFSPSSPAPLFHTIAEMHVCDRGGKKRDRDGYPKNVLHH
jgi:hypothetical protein